MMARIREAGRPDPLAGLSGSESPVLELIGEGLTNHQIAERTHLAGETVKHHASEHGASNRTKRAHKDLKW